MIGVLDFKTGNVGSVLNMLGRLGLPAMQVNQPADMSTCDGLILPGVGAFDACMGAIRRNEQLFDEMNKRVLVDSVPFLGICVGMQILFDESEEGVLPGLGWIPGRIRRFNFNGTGFKVPHMGWSAIKTVKSEARLFKSLDLQRYYFVHSYYAECAEPENVIATASYGDLEFCAAANERHIFGVQFHPEKSHRHGFELLRNFAEICDG